MPQNLNIAELFARYQDLQRYVGWTEEDVARIKPLRAMLSHTFKPLINDFYDEISRHVEASKVITGGTAQVERLKLTLLNWVDELLTGSYDEHYVGRRWRVGWRHVEIGLNQVYTNAALSRLRSGLVRSLVETWTGDNRELVSTIESLHKLLDLDLAIIEDAYQAEYLRRQQRIERLAAIGQMAGGVAHELRQPLNVIKTSVYYILHARQPNPEKIKEHLHRIDAQVGMADGVINAMASYAKLPLPQLLKVTVRECVDTTLSSNPLPPSIDVQVDCEHVPTILTDPMQLQIVLGNLVRNARDAMPQGGKLTIEATEQGDRVQVHVRDSGVGIPPDDLERIMEPLYTTKPRGMGLGLAIARGILDKLNSQLSVQSVLGEGSTFTINLPAAHHQAREVTA